MINQTIITAFILVLIVLSPFLQARSSNEYANKMPTFGPSPTVYVFPLDGNELLSADELHRIESQMLPELKKEEYTPRKVKLLEPELTPFLAATDEATPDSEQFRALFGKYLSAFQLKTDIIVIPSLIVREAKLKDKTAKGDGVTFRITTEKSPGKQDKEDVWDLGENSTYGEWSGTASMYSLRLVAFTAEGKWLFTSYGGVAFPHHGTGLRAKLTKRNAVFTHKSDLIAMNKGIEKAFQPFAYKLKRK